MNSELEGYLDQLLSIRQDAPGIVARLTDEQINWRPAPNRWSIGECFSHLNTAAKIAMRGFDEAIANARARGLTSNGPFAYPLLERFFIQTIEPPPKFRVRAPSVLAPVREVKAADVLREFFEWQDQAARRMREADGLDLRRARTRSPAVSWLRYSLGTGFVIFLAHERRHLWQARQVRQELERRLLRPIA